MASQSQTSLRSRLVLDWCEKGLRFIAKKGGVTQAELDSVDRAFRQLLPKETKLPTKALSELTLQQVERLFHVKEVKDRDEKWDPNLAAVAIFPRGYLDASLRDTEKIHAGSPESETLLRARLNLIFLSVLAPTKDFLPKNRKISLAYEVPLSAKRAVDGKDTKLSGRPDYTVWYGSQTEIETNLVAVEVKTPHEFGKAETQLLAYMAVIRHGRIELNKEDLTIYGLATDSYRFHFYRLSHDGKWMRRSLDWKHSKANKDAVLRMLAWLFVQVANQTPTHSRESSGAQSSRRECTVSVGDDDPMSGVE